MELHHLFAITVLSLASLVVIHGMVTTKANRMKNGRFLIVAMCSVLLAGCSAFAAFTGIAQVHKKTALLENRGEDALVVIEIRKSLALAGDVTDDGDPVLDLDTSQLIADPHEIEVLGAGTPVSVATFSGKPAEIELTRDGESDYQVLVRHDGVLVEKEALTFAHHDSLTTVTRDGLEWANSYPTLIDDELEGWLQ